MPTFLKFDPDLPWVVVTDLDGTLTNGPKNRSPYEWHKVGNDELNEALSLILSGIRLIEKDYKFYRQFLFRCPPTHTEKKMMIARKAGIPMVCRFFATRMDNAIRINMAAIKSRFVSRDIRSLPHEQV